MIDLATDRRLTRDEEPDDYAAPPERLCGRAHPETGAPCARVVGADGTHPGLHDSAPRDPLNGVSWRTDV